MEQTKALTTVIAAAPGAALSAFVFVFAICWAAASLIKMQQIKTLEERLKWREEQLLAFKVATGCESPEQVVSKLLQLSDARNGEGRTLSLKQHTAISRAISSEKIEASRFEIIYSMFGPEPSEFAVILSNAFNAGGWRLQADSMLGARVGARGLSIAVPDLEAKPATAIAVAKALQAANLSFEWEQGDFPEGRLYVDPKTQPL